MAEITKEQVFEFFDSMTLMDLSQFVEEFKERYNVSDAPQMMAAAPAAGAGAGAPAEEEEKTEFTAVLNEVGDKRINVIKEIRGITQLGLKEAKELVENVPSNIKEDVPKEEAEEIKKKLEEAGAKVEIK
ncbi:MAG: 50S ribosomal protein L7/L12 [bacterium]